MPKCPFCGLRAKDGSEFQTHITLKHPGEAIEVGTSQRQGKGQKRKGKPSKKPIIVDGNNVAYYGGNQGEIRKIKNARSLLQKMGYAPMIFVSAALRHNIDNPVELNRIINLGWVIEVSGGEDDDQRILDAALQKKCKIISNDHFSEYASRYNTNDWDVSSNLVKFKFVEDRFRLD